jgi:hypothetical protein
MLLLQYPHATKSPHQEFRDILYAETINILCTQEVSIAQQNLCTTDTPAPVGSKDHRSIDHLPTRPIEDLTNPIEQNGHVHDIYEELDTSFSSSRSFGVLKDSSHPFHFIR